MADSTLAAMTADTNPTTTALFYMVEDPSGTPLNRKITTANILNVINNLTADTAPDRAADYVATYDASASGPKKVLLNNLGAYVLSAAMTNTNPADSTTYYFGNWESLGLSTVADARRIYIQRAGKITKADIYAFNSGTGSNETYTISLRLNNTTDTTLSSSVNHDAAAEHFTNTALSIAVAVGDYFEIKAVTPAWATNPTGVYYMVRIFVE